MPLAIPSSTGNNKKGVDMQHIYNLKSSEFTGNLWPSSNYSSATVKCSWKELRYQLLKQWRKIPADALDDTYGDYRQIAELISGIYNVSAGMIENYLRNFERTMPRN